MAVGAVSLGRPGAEGAAEKPAAKASCGILAHAGLIATLAVHELHDHILYDGKYYSPFGPVPAVVRAGWLLLLAQSPGEVTVKLSFPDEPSPQSSGLWPVRVPGLALSPTRPAAPP